MIYDTKQDWLAGGNWTVNDKEDIYTDIVHMDTDGEHSHTLQLYA